MLDSKHAYSKYNDTKIEIEDPYFMPSILKTKARKVLCYLNKYGFTNIKLTIYIWDISASLEQVVELEQNLIDSLNQI